MRSGASVSQLLAESSGPRGLRTLRALSRRGSVLVSGMARSSGRAEPKLYIQRRCRSRREETVEGRAGLRRALSRDRKSVVEGKSGAVRVDLGGGRTIKQKNEETQTTICNISY